MSSGEVLHGIEIARIGQGSGLPIVLLHEGLGSVALWRDFPAKLADATGREVIAWSRRGYGQSKAGPDAYTPDFMHREADEAAALLGALRIERAHLFGHSDGASIALLVAARHPSLAASLVLEAPHVFVEPICVEQITAFGHAVEDNDTIARMARYHRAPDRVFRRWHDIWIAPEFRDWTIENEIAEIDVPVLLIQGENDEYGTMLQLDRIAARIPQAKRVHLAECGHSPHRDQSDKVLAHTAGFLSLID